MNLTSTGELSLALASGLEEMPEKIRRAFDDFVTLGTRRTYSELHRKYEADKESSEHPDLVDVPTTRLPTLCEWGKKYNWQELAPLAWAQQGIAQRSAASAVVDHGSMLAAEKLIELLGATQAVVLRKDGNQRGSDEIEYVPDNKTRLEAAKTLLDRAGVSSTRIAISEKLSNVSGDGANTQARTIEVEGRSSTELMLALRERLLTSGMQ